MTKIYQGFSKNQMAFEEDLPSTYKLSSEDSNLISYNYRHKLKVIEVFGSKVRNPISMISIDENYRLIIYKIGSANSLLLNDILHTEIKNGNLSTGYTYTVLSNNIPYKFQYKSGIERKGTKIYLTVDGDSLNTFKQNDSIVSYNLICKNISIRYGQNAVVDIFIESKKRSFVNSQNIPVSILFCRRSNNIYLLLLSSDKPNSPIPNNLLYDMVTGN